MRGDSGGRFSRTWEASIVSSEARITSDSMPVVKADPAIEQVLQNLISNAIKYGREGVPPVIHVSAKSEGDMWFFSVQDNGLGIDEADQANVFRTFQRLHGREIPGIGVGLALCKKIVECAWRVDPGGIGAWQRFDVFVHIAQARRVAVFQVEWWALADSNRRPMDYESTALTAVLRARLFDSNKNGSGRPFAADRSLRSRLRSGASHG